MRQKLAGADGQTVERAPMKDRLTISQADEVGALDIGCRE